MTPPLEFSHVESGNNSHLVLGQIKYTGVDLMKQVIENVKWFRS